MNFHDFQARLYCYQSKFGLEWVPVGQCNREISSHISCPSTLSVWLQKVVPQVLESFSLRKALGSNPIFICSMSKSLHNECMFYSSDKALWNY